MHIPLDYPTLRMIWWVLLGILLIGFAVTDGFDLGIGMLLHRVAKSDDERRIVINTIGPIWEGNQVWLILGAGAIFAAWPDIYAVSFSGFYYAMIIILFSLILRPVSIKYRGKTINQYWRAIWDICFFIAGFFPSLVFGIAVGNTLLGVPFYYDQTLQSYYTGSFWQLFNPFALLCGLVSIMMLIMHGGIYLSIKTTNDIQNRASRYAMVAALFTVILFGLGGFWIATTISGYVVTDSLAFDAPSNPLHKQVATQIGSWISNYVAYPKLVIAPLMGLIGPLFAIGLIRFKSFRLAWIASALSIAGIIMTVGFSMFPFILPSSSNPDMSLTVWDASSSQTTLFIMLIVTAIFIPLIIAYTSWVYYVMRGKVTKDSIQPGKHAY